MNERTPKYTIRVVAQMVGMHEQSLRMYERKGLICPQRSGGNIRLFSDADVERVRFIKRLVDDLGVNLAGAEVILHMREQMELLQHEMEQLRHRSRHIITQADREW
jgi:MerR family transcriptional regulator/heat shock protein HspR